LLRPLAARVTLQNWAEEFMRDERVIAHDNPWSSNRPGIRRSWCYLLGRQIYQFNVAVTYCRNVNRQIESILWTRRAIELFA
jgi:hypothetical protein